MGVARPSASEVTALLVPLLILAVTAPTLDLLSYPVSYVPRLWLDVPLSLRSRLVSAVPEHVHPPRHRPTFRKNPL